MQQLKLSSCSTELSEAADHTVVSAQSDCPAPSLLQQQIPIVPPRNCSATISENVSQGTYLCFVPVYWL